MAEPAAWGQVRQVQVEEPGYGYSIAGFEWALPQEDASMAIAIAGRMRLPELTARVNSAIIIALTMR